MRREIVVQPPPHLWSEASILRPYVSQYGEHLQRRRYAASTRRVYVCCVAHFGHWLTQERYDLEAIGQGAVMRFLSEHLPACACPYPVRRSRHDLQAALGHLLEVLQSRRRVVAGSEPQRRHRTGVDALRRPHARRLGPGGEHPPTVSQGGQEISSRRFRRAAGHHGEGQRRIHPVLRSRRPEAQPSLDRRDRRRHCLLSPFSQHVRRPRERSVGRDPRAAHWRLASLPEVLTDAEINQLLRSFDQPFPSRQRAYAMVRCLIDLGLRSSEVVKLQLDHVNWADGTIDLVGTKGGRADVLPLPTVTGAAIASYLREERPPTSNRAIFVRHVAPYDEPIEPE